VRVTDTPTNLEISQVGGACTELPCTIASLESGADATITVTATVIAGGAFDNTASVSATEADPNVTNNSDATGNGGVAVAGVASIPALSAIGLVLLAMLMVLAGVAILGRRRGVR
jgi:hypothetical protein